MVEVDTCLPPGLVIYKSPIFPFVLLFPVPEFPNIIDDFFLSNIISLYCTYIYYNLMSF